MIKGVIWSYDRAGDGIRQLEYIRDRYGWNGINPTRIKCSRNESLIEFENGDSWRVAPATENSRGIRSNYALIDARIPEEFCRVVILPTLSYRLSGFRYYEFFYPEEW